MFQDNCKIPSLVCTSKIEVLETLVFWYRLVHTWSLEYFSVDWYFELECFGVDWYFELECLV